VIRPSPARPATLEISRRIDQSLLVLFLIALSLVLWNTLQPIPAFTGSAWPNGLLLVCAVASVIGSVSRTLPFQNIIWAALVIGGLGGLTHAVGVLTSIPFGPITFTNAAGLRILGVVPVSICLLWILSIYSSRGVARLILKPWRKTRVYGFWLIGITAALSLVLDLALEPFASRLNHHWLWGATRLPWDWYGTPLTNFVGWTVTALMILVFVTPMLINKKPGEMSSEFGSSIVWFGLHGLLIAAAFHNGFWIAGAVCSLTALLAGILAVRGARW
jgi:uncharacterized membrane protein